MSGKLCRQLLGLNPFKQSYISLYSCLDAKDKTIACGAVLFAIAAGLPLPIIGVIFGRLISSFPPSEDELSTRISQLLGVAVAYLDTNDIEVNGLLTQTIDNIQAGCSEKVGIFIQSLSYFVAAL
ncbi:hypothetical protein LTR85_011972 [Meristemomyces frigidus]|nr:hypothetical protein LTR85_011972 [Meristemomyces frigidus]